MRCCALRRPCLVSLLLLLPGCGPAAANPPTVTVPGAEVQPSPSASGSAALPPKSRAAELVNAPAFDTAGNSAACRPPLDSCPNPVIDTAFTDRCRLAGYQVRQCGCDIRCSGNVAGQARRYDAEGHVKTCEKSRSDCALTPASSALQDACAARGFRLEMCGCEWLCTGDPSR